MTQFALFPNPAQDFVYVNREISSQWNIIDVNGRTIKSGMLRSKAEEIDIAGLATGIYILEVVNPRGEVGTSKFVHD